MCAYFARPVVVIYKLPPYDIASRPYKNFIAGCISNIPGLAVTAMQMCLSVQAQFYFVRSRESRRERRAPPLPPLTRNVANGNSISSNPLESLRSAFSSASFMLPCTDATAIFAIIHSRRFHTPAVSRSRFLNSDERRSRTIVEMGIASPGFETLPHFNPKTPSRIRNLLLGILFFFLSPR